MASSRFEYCMSFSDGAAECGEDITRHFVSKGAVLRNQRRNFVLFAVAALSCTCAGLFVLTQVSDSYLRCAFAEKLTLFRQSQRSELFSPWLANEAPVPSQRYAWNGLKDYHSAISKGLAGEVGDSPLQGSAAREMANDPENLAGLLGPDGYNAYHEAVTSAAASHLDLSNLVRHYQSFDSTSGLTEGITLGSRGVTSICFVQVLLLGRRLSTIWRLLMRCGRAGTRYRGVLIRPSPDRS
jgi:hypothetical protein